jgi:hypothetical protein
VTAYDTDEIKQLVGYPSIEGKAYVGAYALKLYYASHKTERFGNDLIATIRDAGIAQALVPGMWVVLRSYSMPHIVLTWHREWRTGRAMVVIRGYGKKDVEDAELKKKKDQVLHAGIECDRHEIFAQTNLKRTLVEFNSLSELFEALADVIQGTHHCRFLWMPTSYIGTGVVDLAKIKILHRDISMCNILLAREEENPKFFEDESARATKIFGERFTFKQRRVTATNLCGLLHDFDMSGKLLTK